jgi:hypothetical protein
VSLKIATRDTGAPLYRVVEFDRQWLARAPNIAELRQVGRTL